MSACRPDAPRRRRAALTALAALALSACGGGQRQDVAESSHSYAVQITAQSFPSAQTIAQHSNMVLTVKNVSGQPIPNLAVTVCNVTCAYGAPAGQGTSSGAFASNLSENDLASPSRPVWIVDQPPGACQGRSGYSCASGGPGADASAYTDTWVAGRVVPGQSVTFRWRVTAVKTGHFVLAWMVAAGLNGKAKAYVPGGGVPQGRFTVDITRKPAQSYVNNGGQIVPTS